MCLLCFHYCRSFNVKDALFTEFVMTQQTDFAARCCFWFPANDPSIDQVCPLLLQVFVISGEQLNVV